MAKAIGPIYVAVVTSRVMLEPQDFHIYSKSTSNREVMVAYVQELQARYPHKKVYLMTREKAKEQQKKFYAWRKAQEEEKLARCDRNLNKLLGRMVYAEGTQRVSQQYGIHR